MDLTEDLCSWFESDVAREILTALDARRLPKHIAVIMDGNGRWAKQRGKPRLFGHKAGVAAVREAIATCVRLGIDYLTIYSFSSENWTRPADEVSGLMQLFVEVLGREIPNLNEQHVRVRLIGDTQALPSKTRDAFADCVTRTAGNDGLTLVVALNYGARADLAAAARSLATDAASGTLDPGAIDTDMLAARLSTAGIPDPDLVIRTSGEQRLSNFLLYEVAYAEMLFAPTLWPDFGRDELLAAIRDYQNRDRRFGGLGS